MKIKLDDYEKKLIEEIAEEYEVGAEDLAECYKEVMICNFEQDVIDSAKDNINELRKDYHNGKL